VTKGAACAQEAKGCRSSPDVGSTETMRVSDLEWEPGSNRVSWCCGKNAVVRICDLPLQSVCVLQEGDAVAIVENYLESGPTNAVIIDCDGSVRVRLSLPLPADRVHGYDSMYYIAGRLAAILASTSGDWAAVVNPITGELSELRESR